MCSSIQSHSHIFYVLTVGLGNIENVTLWLLQQSLRLLPWYCITIIKRTQNHYTCVPLETATASFSIGMNLWVSIVTVGNKFNWYAILQYNDVHYVAMFCDILHMWYYWFRNVKMFVILILQALTLQGGDNIEILPNHR